MVAYITHTHGSHSQAGQPRADSGGERPGHDVHVAPRGRSPVALRLQQPHLDSQEQKTSDEPLQQEGVWVWDLNSKRVGVPFPERAT